MWDPQAHAPSIRQVDPEIRAFHSESLRYQQEPPLVEVVILVIPGSRQT